MNGIFINEFVPVFRMFNNRKDYILNIYLIVDDQRLSNGPTEGANSQIKKLMRAGNGFSNFIRSRNRVMHCYKKKAIISPVDKKITKFQRKREKYKKIART